MSASDFGCKVIYYSASGKTQDVPYEREEFDEFLKKSDIISIHAPLNDKTNNLFNKEAFDKMKTSTVLLNLGRGPIVNDADLTEALEQGKIAGLIIKWCMERLLRQDLMYLEKSL